MARRAVLQGEKLGWIRVRRRNGGAHTRSNDYALTISPAVLIPTNPADHPNKTGIPSQQNDPSNPTTELGTNSEYTGIVNIQNSEHLESPLASLADSLKKEGSRAGPPAPGAEERPPSDRQTSRFETNDSVSAAEDMARFKEHLANYNRHIGREPRQ